MPDITVAPPQQQTTLGQPTSMSAVFHGLNGVDPPSLIGDDEVATATNIDFTLEYGAAAVRRGSQKIITVSTNTHAGSIPLVGFYSDLQGAPSNTDGFIYANKGAELYRITPGTGTASNTYTSTLISSASGVTAGWVGGNYRSYGYFMGGPGASAGLTMVKDNGSTVTDWIPQSPTGTMSVTVNTLTALTVGGTNTFTIIEGTGTVSGGTATVTSDPATFRVEIDIAIPAGLNTNGTHTIGDMGLDSVDLWLSDPKSVVSISRDYGLTTASGSGSQTDFTNYYHTELNLLLFQQAYGDPETLVESLLENPVQVFGTVTLSQAIDLAQRQQMIQNLRTNIRSVSTVISQAKEVFNAWIVQRVNFQPVIRSVNPGVTWAAVGTGRVVVQGTGVFTVKLRNWIINGAQDYSLTDVDLGYAWWETFASFDSQGNLLAESNPSPATARKQIQGCNVTLTSTNTATGTQHGITHRIFYRQGGMLNDAYAVGTNSYAVASFTDTMGDISALSLDERMVRNIAKVADFGNVAPRAVSEPFYERLFVLCSNTLRWSLPGRAGTFPLDSEAVIGNGGDLGISLVVWPPGLIIINDHSVYEMVGSIFEGGQADYVLTRSGSRHGSKAPLASIRTPHGIPLLDYDGLYMYIPGQGIEQPLDWVMSKIGDMWRGQATSDPAGYKGNRLPAIDMNFLFYSCSAYTDNRLYLGLPCENPGNARCNVVVVIDFRYQQVQVFKYPFTFNSLYWDQFKNRLYCLSDIGGNLIQLETGLTDFDDSSAQQGVAYTLQSRDWATPADVLLENLAVRVRGGTSSALAIYDGTTTATVGTFTQSAKVWEQPPLSGSFANAVAFVWAGTNGTAQQNALYNINWDAFVHPKKVKFYRTDYDDNGIEGEKIWDVHYTDMEVIPSSGTGTVLATSFIDGTAVATYSLTGDTNHSKRRYTFAYPVETYGNKEYTIYQAQGTGVVFKLWEHNNGGRPEPPRVTSFVTDRESGRERWWKELMIDANALSGTMTATFFVDEVAISTQTISDSFTDPRGREVYPFALPTETYGKTVYTKITSSSGFKLYKVWYISEEQPDRLLFWEVTYDTSDSNDVIKTWTVEAHPLNGTITGTLFVDATAVMTATFTGNRRYQFEVGTPNITVGKALKAQYSSTTVFKHFNTRVERQPKPFLKKTWNVIYTKPGGATQLDLARFYEIDIESVVTATVTSSWYSDNVLVHTTTLTNPAGNRTYTDRISFPPGIRGYDFQQLMSSSQEFHLWKSNIDIERVGVKGFSRVTYVGTPADRIATHEVQNKDQEKQPQPKGFNVG